jgi:hypothetical protein
VIALWALLIFILDLGLCLGGACAEVGVARVGDTTAGELDSLTLAHGPQTAIPLLSGASVRVDERAWLTMFERYYTEADRGLDAPSLDVYVVSVARAWHFRSGLEPQLIAGLVYAAGDVGPWADYPWIDAAPHKAVGGAIGGNFRWNAVETKGVRIHLDFSPTYWHTNFEVPAGGTEYNWFLRSGGGLSIPVDAEYSIDLNYRWSHISNAQKQSGRNPGWDGKGVCVGLRRVVR